MVCLACRKYSDRQWLVRHGPTRELSKFNAAQVSPKTFPFEKGTRPGMQGPKPIWKPQMVSSCLVKQVAKGNQGKIALILKGAVQGFALRYQVIVPVI